MNSLHFLPLKNATLVGVLNIPAAGILLLFHICHVPCYEEQLVLEEAGFVSPMTLPFLLEQQLKYNLSIQGLKRETAKENVDQT